MGQPQPRPTHCGAENNIFLFSPRSGGQMSRIKVSHGVDSCWRLRANLFQGPAWLSVILGVLGLWTHRSNLCLHLQGTFSLSVSVSSHVFSWCPYLLLPVSHWTGAALIHMTSIEPITSAKALSPNKVPFTGFQVGVHFGGTLFTPTQ